MQTCKTLCAPTCLTMGFDVIPVVAIELAQNTVFWVLDKPFFFFFFNVNDGPG